MHANWNDVWNLARGVFASERIELQILTGLGIAFGAIMILEGLRASFFPARHGLETSVAIVENSMLAEDTSRIEASAPQQFMARAMPANPKRKQIAPRRQQAFRPTIKRVANIVEPHL